MSILDKLFGESYSGKNGKKFWLPLESENDLVKAMETSFAKPTVIFKHSVRCFISKTVLQNFEKEVENNPVDAAFYYLDLIKHRALSNKIAEDFHVTHQSPQVIVLKDGKPVADASHQSISVSLIP